MNLSICIPTYNRCEYLKKNLILLISQIRQYGLNNRVQICISNNCSTDGTDQMIKLFVTENKDISIIYSCNKENLGADKNFIAVMKMAMFEYSILLGDDDYFKDGALKQIFDIIEPLRFVDIFLSNRTEILTDGTFFRDRKFLNCESCLFDFSNKQDINLYFHSVATLGGALCFISSVIYKTEIVVGDFDKRFYGTQYAFLYYFWGKLLNGGKLKYNNVS